MADRQKEIFFSFLLPLYRVKFIRPRPDLTILPQRNSAGFCSTRGKGWEKAARILANGRRFVIHRLFTASGGKMSSLQVASAAFVFVNHVLSRRRKRRQRRWWRTEL
jgi:hypothetical protein